MSSEQIFKRNLEWAYLVKYDLDRIHSRAVVDMLKNTADELLLDAQTLSIALRTAAAYHEDRGSVLIANAPQRSKFIVEFNLVITNVGSGKSTIINSLIDTARKKRAFDCRRSVDSGQMHDEMNYRHDTVQEFTGPGILKALGRTGNVFIVIDEFDGNHHQSGMFPSDVRSPVNAATSANSVMKSLHTGMTTYQKAKVSDKDCVKDPHACFLGASNGAPVLDIIKYKLKNPSIADAMVMRTVFDAVKSTPKFNAMYANKQIPQHSIGWEIFLLASSLVTNQTYVFDIQSTPSANSMMLDYMDTVIAASSRWDGIDPWISSRFAKTCELVARLAAQFCHIDLTMSLLQDFMMNDNITDGNTIVSYERYCSLREFIHSRFPPTGSTVTINDRQVEAAMYAADITLLKYFNLFDTSPTRREPYDEVPLIPPVDSFVSNNATAISLPLTQGLETGVPSKQDEVQFKQLIMTFQSVVFTRTMLYQLPRVRARNEALDIVLNELIASNLLRKLSRGVSSGNSRSDLYVKCLPTSLTQNTTNEWVKNVLDQVKLPWPTFIKSCSTVIFPSASSTFSNEVNELLQTEPYNKLITAQVRPSVKAPRMGKKKGAVGAPPTKAMDNSRLFEKSNSGTMNPPTPIGRLDTTSMSAQKEISSSVNSMSLPTRSSLTDESANSDPSNTFTRSENTVETGEETSEETSEDGYSILSSLAPRQQQETIMFQSRDSSSQSSLPSTSLRSSITLVSNNVSTFSSSLASVNDNLPSPRSPPVKERSSNAVKRRNDMDSDLSKENREDYQQNRADRTINIDHLADRTINIDHPADRQTSAARKSNRSRKRPARFDSPDCDAGIEPLDNGEAKRTCR